MRRGAVLTVVFVGVLTTGAATGSWGGLLPGDEEAAEHAEAEPPDARPVVDRKALLERGAREGPLTDAADGAALDADVLVSRSGDRWSTAYSAREYQGQQQALSGEYVGVGVSVRRTPGGATQVAEVLSDSPAERAGVRVGDTLRRVGGHPVDGRPVTEVVGWLRGNGVADAGTRVVVELVREGEPRTVELTRAALVAETVTVSRLSAEVTRIEITSFTEGSGQRVREAVHRVPEGSGILLDLRGNSGGLVAEAVTAASAFLDGGLVATYGVEGTQRALYAESGDSTEAPLVVLVDAGTMSAAELLTGALQDRGRAIVVGTRTFGKGTVQMPREQPDGSVAELTVGEYATPNGRSVEGTGLLPDLVVQRDDEAERRARTVLSGLATRA